MPTPAKNTLAIVGAGPIGLEAAVAALDAGFDVHVFERGEVAAHTLAWGHVQMFTPWRMDVGPSARAHLERAGWTMPDPERCPTGAELASAYLEPLAALPELRERVHPFSQVVHIARRRVLKGDAIGAREIETRPFRLMVRDPAGRENLIHAFHVIDASGVYGQPNWAGDGGIPARQESYLAPQMSYHVDDVLGLRRERYAGKRTLVIGAGTSAASTVVALVHLAREAPGTTVSWVTRRPAAELYPPDPSDVFPERRALVERIRALLAGGAPEVFRHIGGVVVDGFEFNSATHRYRARLAIGEETRLEEADHVIVNTGYGPDGALHRELRVALSPRTLAPVALTVALEQSDDGCVSPPAFDAGTLASGEPGFFILGHKSYGRRNDFLLETGYRQVAAVIAQLAGERAGTSAD